MRHKVFDSVLVWLYLFFVFASLVAGVGLFIAGVLALVDGSVLLGIGYITGAIAIGTTLLVLTDSP